jgi:sugar lactone lactonase YvrE
VTAPELGAWEAIWMGLEDTEAEDGWYPCEWDVTFNELSIFEKKISFGRIDKDSDDIVSSYVMSDWSGGGQIDLLTGADQSRYRHGILDARTPGGITLPQYVEELLPSGASGTCYPGYTLGEYSFHIFGSNVYGWDESDDSWSAATAVAHTPVGKPTVFGSGLYWPLGTSGYAILTDSGGGTPVWNRYAGVSEAASSTATSSPNVVDFEVWDNKIWALTPTGVLAYSFTGADGAWNWDQAWDEARADFMQLDTGREPVRLVTFPDNNGDPTLTIISDAAAYRVDFVSKNYDKTAIQFPPHPDFGRGVAIFRPGEDLKIAVGLGMVSYSAAGVVDPDTGLSRNDGMPYTNLGTITDLEPDPSNLYACVSGTQSSATAYAYSDQVGAAGTGNGQFADVRGLVVDSTGDVQSCDENNERVQRFDNLLTYEGQHGSSGTGDDNYAADNGPYDIAVDSSDNLFVIDRGNNRIKKLSRLGVFDSELTGSESVSAWTLSATYGSLGSGNDNYTNPKGVDVDSAGNIFVADSGNNRVVKRDSSGVYVAKITGFVGNPAGVCIDSSDDIYVTNPGFGNVYKFNGPDLEEIYDDVEVTEPYGICTDDTSLWITDTDDDKVYKTLADGSDPGPYTNWGGTGSTNGKFNDPRGICVDATYVYVVDRGNNRMQKFTKAGVYTAQWVIGSGSDHCCLDTSGNILIAQDGNNTVSRYTNVGVFVDSFARTTPSGVACIAGDIVYATDTGTDNLTKWDEVTTSVPGSGDAEFTSPESLDIKRSSGRIYLADTGNKRVQYYSSAWAFGDQWGSAGSGNSQFGALGPTALAVDQSSGDVYVVDPSNFRIQAFDASGTFLRAWGDEGTNNGQFQLPTCIDVNPATGSVFVGDATRDDVQEFSSSGVYLRRFGASGSGNGQFTGISGLAFNQAGTLLYAADSSGERIQAFDVTTSTFEFLARPSIHYWTGTGWHGAWELEDSEETLTWATITATSHATDGYRLNWGCTDGNLYSMPLRRTFHNPRSGWQAGYDRFAETGYLISSRFDALMSGFYKKASRLVIFMDNASPTERVRIQYRIDDELMPWTDFTDANGDVIYVDSTDRTVLAFGVDADGFSWGEQFNWIQFKFLFERGSNAYQTPVMTACVLNFTKVPQQARTFMFTVPFPKESWNGRTGIEIRNGLADLLRAGQYVKLVHQDTTYRGQLAAVAGLSSLGQNTTGGATVNFIEIRTDG